MSSERPERPLALAVLEEELRSLASDFDRVAALTDTGERAARTVDLLRALDRYLRLEAEVLLPVLERTGFDAGPVRRSHAEVRAMIGQAEFRGLAQLRAAFEAHAQSQRERAFPAACRLPGAEQEALAYELDEVRNRMRGAYGV